MRDQLQKTVAASAAPYGYTLTIFSFGSVAGYEIGRPHILEVLLFLAGAVLAFLVIELVAFGGLNVRLRPQPEGRESFWGHAHLFSAGAAIGSVWLVLQILATDVAWVIVGFVATVVYLVLDALQAKLASD